jgi:thioredoxin-related protein
MVAVRVDVESEAGPGGTPGHELAARYAVSSFPAQMLIDPQGRVIARYDGYQTPRQLLTWLDGVPDARPAGNPAATLAGSGR